MEFIVDHFSGLLGLSLIAFGTFAIIVRNRKQRRAQKILQKAIETQSDEPLTLHPEISESLCVGCAACVTACPEGEILQLIHHKAVLVQPTKCVGHGECERACPMQAISLVFGTKTRGMDIPRISKDYETNIPGLYIAGELGGMGLIRNAIKQGSQAAHHALSSLRSRAETNVADLLIVGAGPAGLSAALVAIEKQKSYVCIEQNSFGGTVYNFPRQKIVMTHPAQLPLVGTMKFSKNKVSKEELLNYWNQIRIKTRLKVMEHTKFDSVSVENGVFRVVTNRGEFKAQKVILAMGVRGSPRKLGLPNEEISKVAYNLIEVDQYQKKSIVVVGGGNAGVEAAQMLAEPKLANRVILVVRGPSFDRCNEENDKKIRAMESQGLLEIWWNSNVKEIHPDSLKVMRENRDVTIPNDYLFVFAGAESPHKMLMNFGVTIDKKFGEALR